MKITTERHEQKFCNVTIFTWEEWDEVETGALQYYNVEFPFESMKMYNGSDVFYTLEGKLEIYVHNEAEVIWSGWLTDIPEVREHILKGE